MNRLFLLSNQVERKRGCALMSGIRSGFQFLHWPNIAGYWLVNF